MVGDKALVARTVTGGSITVDIGPGKTIRGICQGASGSGKSEFLTTLLCELAQCPYRNLIIFDEKGVSFVDLLPRLYILDQQVRFNEVLSSLCGEQKRRLVALKSLKKKSLTPQDGYNQIDIVIDEASSFLNPDDNAITKTMREERLRMLCSLG